MTEPEDLFDVDAAIARLRRRESFLWWGWVLAGVLCLLLGWQMVDPLQVLLGDPLHPVLRQVHFPGPAVHANGDAERATSVGERLLAYSSLIVVIAMLLLARRLDRTRKYLVLGCGTGLLTLILIGQTAVRGETFANQDLVRLADQERYAELANRAAARRGMPYADYIAAQALVLSGGGAELRAVHGEWLAKWSEQAATLGYAGNDHRAIPTSMRWEGMHASPAVMHTLELLAFGSGPTAYSTRYLHQAQAAVSDARREMAWLLPPAVLMMLLGGTGAIAWWKLRANLRATEKWLVRFDYYDPAADHEASRPGALPHHAAPADSLPPIDFADPGPLPALTAKGAWR
jgi:hypothetical protein